MSRRTVRRLAAAVALMVGASTVSVVAGERPAFADQAIVSPGPLRRIFLNDRLLCQAYHVDDVNGQFYGDEPGFCATALNVAGVLYSELAGYQFTPVSQSPVTGTGTPTDPYQVVTVVNLGATGLTMTQTDSYIVGAEAWRTDVVIANGTAAPIPATLYKAADCYVGDNDEGPGATFPAATGTAVACQGSLEPSRYVGFLPLTPGSHFFEGHYITAYATIPRTGANYPDTIDPDPTTDSGAGLSWQVSVPANGAVSVSHMTFGSPTFVVPVTFAASVSPGTVPAGDTTTYSIDMADPTLVAVDTIAVTLPAGFAYQTGSATGVTSA